MKHLWLAVTLIAWWLPNAAVAETTNEIHQPTPSTAAEAVRHGIEDAELSHLIVEILERHPQLARQRAQAEAARHGVPQAGALPDPMLSLNAFPAPPETRTGPQRLQASFSQGLPWRGKRRLARDAADHRANALQAEVEAVALELVGKARRLYYELAFLERRESIVRSFREHLLQHEEVARARYATGVGSGQGVVKLQAAITQVDSELLTIATRRATLNADLNALRDRPAGTVLPAPRLAPPHSPAIEAETLAAAAYRNRPELAASAALVARSESLLELERKNNRPNFRVGLAYTMVDTRQDLPGRLQPPPDNGDDIVALLGAINLPLWKRPRAAAVDEAEAMRSAANEASRTARNAIDGELADLTERIPLYWRQLRLLDDVLLVQAEEALESAEAGYITGTLNALDLLDAEHVLFETQTGVARAATDYAVAVARLESAIGASLDDLPAERRP